MHQHRRREGLPEEVEEALKLHPSVHDAVVVGVAHERFGEAIVAVVQLRRAQAFDEAVMVEHVKSRLASYKAPTGPPHRHDRAAAQVARSTPRFRQFALDELRSAPTGARSRAALNARDADDSKWTPRSSCTEEESACGS